MTTVVLDAETSRRIREGGDFVELRDPDGHIVGHFTPQPYRPEWLDPGISAEELSRRAADGRGRPLSEILRDLAAKS